MSKYRAAGEHGAVLEHIAPPGVGTGVDAHVVRDEVQDVRHAVRGERLHERVVVVGGTQLRVQLVVVRDVVAVRTARPGRQIGDV